MQSYLMDSVPLISIKDELWLGQNKIMNSVIRHVNKYFETMNQTPALGMNPTKLVSSELTSTSDKCLCLQDCGVHSAYSGSPCYHL